jgi:hypothetical protein
MSRSIVDMCGATRCEGARAAVQGKDGLASKGLLGRMQGARAIKSGSRKGGNPGSNRFQQMQAESYQGTGMSQADFECSF